MVEISPYSALTNLGRSSTDRVSLAENFDSFLSLLITQLRHQSPLDPIDTNQFTQQLVQFTEVEQTIKQNENLEKLIQLSAANTITNIVGFLGDEVTLSGNSAELSGGSATWNYEIEADADNAIFTVLDSNGVPIYSTSGPAPGGKNVFVWQGQTNSGATAADGSYKLTISATDNAGAGLEVTTQIVGIVDGMNLSGDEPVLLIGNRKVKLDEIVSVRLPNTPST